MAVSFIGRGVSASSHQQTLLHNVASSTPRHDLDAKS
jgi:hypothetical protein